MPASVFGVLEAYPYLFACLFSLVVFGVFWFGTRSQRRMMVVSGVLYVPFAPLAATFHQEYWCPARLGGWILGVEDALFAFVTGGMAWWGAACCFRSRVNAEILTRTWPRRFLIFSAFGVTLFFLLRLIDIEAMFAQVFVQVAFAILFLSLRASLWPLALSGPCLYTPIYYLIVRGSFWMWPDFITHWNESSQWGILFCGVPLGEIASAATFAVAWPLGIAYVFDVAFTKR